MFTEIKPTRAYEQIIEQIKENIRNKKLRKGDKLPPERTMAEQMGVSRLTVREALSYLIAIGLVEHRAGNGNYIGSDLSDLLYEPVYMYMLLEDIEFREVLSLRNMLQVQCVGMCCDNITEAQLAALCEICARFSQCENHDELIDLDVRFHSLIAEGTNQKLFLIIHNSISAIVRDHLSYAWAELFADKKKLRDTVCFHLDILDALKKRDGDTAVRTMQRHFDYVEKNVG